MIKRTIEISTHGTYVHTKDEQLVIEKDGLKVGSVPIEDLGVLILDSPQLLITSSVMRSLAEQNVAVIFTDQKHLPSSLTIPFSVNSIQTKILNAQIEVSLPTKKRLWAAIISAKIANQARSLEICGRDGTALREIAGRVKSGDSENLEAFAARQYWRKLFGDDFRRDREAHDHNMLLNYGYAIVRAATARAIVGTGLHPSLGINHKNQYNPFPLADDLIEPLRPFVDVRVFEMLADPVIPPADPHRIALDRPAKARLLSLLAEDCAYDGRRLPMMSAIGYYAASVKQVMMGEADKLLIPVL
ncbi:MAG: type II CRISPR-associated endonuclease Cas1 [Acidobacteria bacterium]|nr:type II CRISPR-associated endonuclease Cas1 [Acidobacteriota bacterium]MCW5949846.1 type II CRISPR-associated endonuclease Cas1 [Pyrinomonadaceae bacterium]